MSDLAAAAATFVEAVDQTRATWKPPGDPVIFRWRDMVRVGCVHSLPHGSVTLVSVNSRALPSDFIAEIKRLRPSWPEITVDPTLGFEGTTHIVSLRGRYAGFMSPEETRWAAAQQFSLRYVNE